ncbi:MAG: RIO1 family regulatory kinase/ATPase [Planctomycetota bacterium]
MLNTTLREKLNRNAIKVLKDNPPLSPVTKLIDLDGRKVVLKDYSQRAWWVKDVWGRLLINHEYYILKRLAGQPGVPKAVSLVDEYAFLSEYINGQPLSKFKPDTLPPIFFEYLTEEIKKIHAGGVVHLDLGQKKNIMADEKFRPFFIDFANALYFRREAFGFKQLFDLLCLIDRGALLKFKHRLFPGLLTRSEKKFLKRFLTIRRLWIFKRKKYRPKDVVK